VLLCTSSETGEQIWTLPLEGNLEQAGGHLAAAPVAAGKWLFLATLDGKIHQIEPGTGRVHRSFDIEGAMRFSPVIDQGRIYATTQNGKAVCIDTGDRSLTGWPVWGRNAAHTNVYD
jgi:Ca-activated chloride channel family protein